MIHIPITFDARHLDKLLAKHPPRWQIGRRQTLPVTGLEAIEIRDAEGELVVEVDNALLAEGLVAAIESVFLHLAFFGYYLQEEARHVPRPSDRATAGATGSEPCG